MSPSDASPRGEQAEGARVVGSFEILSEIGHGGMGVVYRARDLKLGRDVALKCTRPELAADPEFRRRFMREARAASRLLHPHVTTVFEVFEHDGVPWLAMELVEGASLRSLLAAGAPLPVEQILAHAEGLADALKLAHGEHILHRDINPNNVLIGKDGRARLSDFGLACAFVEPGAEPFASTLSADGRSAGAGAGTRGYMSPEQALGKPLDARSDLFSLGLVLYEMCTGRPAFLRRDSGEWLDALLHREPMPAVEVNPAIPGELWRIVHKAIAKQPFQRYQSAAEMLLDVRALRRRLEAEAARASRSYRRISVRRWRSFALAIAAVVALAALGVWTVLRARPETGLGAEWTPRQLTSAPGWEAEPALSPDGSLVAYASDESGNPDIWLIDVRGGNPLRLTDDPAPDRYPAWFPDGSSLAFVSDRDGGSAVWRVARLGGAPVQLVPDAEDPAIAPDGTRIAFARRGATGQLRIAVAPLGEPERGRFVSGDKDGLWDHRHPTWSPDGRTLCYADFRDLWLVSADGGDARRLTTDHETDMEPVWSADGRWIHFASLRGGTLALWRVAAAGGRPRRMSMSMGTGPEREPSVCCDGARLAYSTYVSNLDVVVLDRASGLRSRLPGLAVDATPGVAPDGSAVVFSSGRAGTFDLWLQPLDRGRPKGDPLRLTDHPGSAAMGVFSPNGRWIAYFRVLGGERDIWAVPHTGGLPVRLTNHPGIDIQPAFSPDGSRLAFVSDRGGGQSIWVANIGAGLRLDEPRRVTSGELADHCPAWSRDGSQLAYVSDSEVWIVAVDSGDPPKRVTHGANAKVAAWDPLGGDLLVSGVWDTDKLQLRRVSLHNGGTAPLEPPVVLGDARSSGGVFGIAADGSVLAYQLDETRGDLWLVDSKASEH